MRKEQVQVHLHNHIEMLDRQMRSKNVKIKCVINEGYTVHTIKVLFLYTVKNIDVMENDEVKIVKRNESAIQRWFELSSSESMRLWYSATYWQEQNGASNEII